MSHEVVEKNIDSSSLLSALVAWLRLFPYFLLKIQPNLLRVLNPIAHYVWKDVMFIFVKVVLTVTHK